MTDVGQLAQEVQSEMTASAASSTAVTNYTDTVSVEPDNTLPSSSEPRTSTSHYTELEPGAVLEMNISSATQSTVSCTPNDLGTNEPKQPEPCMVRSFDVFRKPGTLDVCGLSIP